MGDMKEYSGALDKALKALKEMFRARNNYLESLRKSQEAFDELASATEKVKGQPRIEIDQYEIDN